MKRVFSLLLIVFLLVTVFIIPIHASSNRPIVVIESIEAKPFPVIAGNEFELKLDLANQGNQSARWVVIYLESIEGSDGLGSFSVLSHDNNIHLGRIDRDKEASGVFNMISSGHIEPGLYNLNFVLKYCNEKGIEYESNHVTGIIVTEDNLLSLFNIDLPDEAELGDEIILEGEFANTGKHEAEGVSIKVSGDLDFSSSEYFIGTMESGDTDMFSFKTTAHKAGNMKVRIEASYTDSMNKKIVTGVDKKILIPQPKEEPIDTKDEESKSDDGFFSAIIGFLKGLFGLG